jgi:hypothetical protein
MVGDHDVHAELVRAAHRLDRRDAAIHRDDQPDAARVRALDRADRQAIAVPRAMRDVVRDARAEIGERAMQEVGRGDAVDVVVAVDQRGLGEHDRAPNPLDRVVDAEQEVRVVEVVHRRVEEPLRRAGIEHAAVHEHLGGGQRQPPCHGRAGGPDRDSLRGAEPIAVQRMGRSCAGPRFVWGHPHANTRAARA